MKLSAKICAACGRAVTWRKKWERDWERVKYCSAACRSHGKGGSVLDQKLEASILLLLSQRKRGETICPSEVARDVGAEAWAKLMEPVRRAARRLVMADRVEITQRGRVVDPSTARGPIRIRLSQG